MFLGTCSNLTLKLLLLMDVDSVNRTKLREICWVNALLWTPCLSKWSMTRMCRDKNYVNRFITWGLVCRNPHSRYPEPSHKQALLFPIGSHTLFGKVTLGLVYPIPEESWFHVGCELVILGWNVLQQVLYLEVCNVTCFMLLGLHMLKMEWVFITKWMTVFVGSFWELLD